MGEATLPKTILIVDDDDDFRDPLAIVLEHAGYRIRCASDGDQGLRMAIEESPDLIILDFMMPAKDGFEVSHEIRRRPALRGVPILALTAFGRDIGEIHGLSRSEAPPNILDFLEKPVEFNVLLERVAQALADR